MFDVFYNEIRQHTLDEYPNEACGFIIDEKYIRVGNIHYNPNANFMLHKSAWVDYVPKASAFIHSHPDWHPCPSEEDMMCQSEMKIPWGIISTDGTETSPITWLGDDGVNKLPLVGRGFCHGVTDCYDIIRDWYYINRGIRLKNFPRSWEWWSSGKDLYNKGFSEAGFYKVPQEDIDRFGPKVGDVFLACIGRTKVINHGGVYIGNGLGLHHLTSTMPVDSSRLSKTDPISRWQSYITMWVRYAEEDSITR